MLIEIIWSSLLVSRTPKLNSLDEVVQWRKTSRPLPKIIDSLDIFPQKYSYLHLAESFVRQTALL